MNRRELIKSAAAFTPLPFLAACSGNSVIPNLLPKYLINSQMISSQLLPHFPYSQQLSGIGNISLTRPSFQMAPDINKVRVGLGVQASVAQGLAQATGIPALGGFSGLTRSGNCVIACGLRYDKSTRGIYLKDPVLETLDMVDIPTYYTSQAQNLINTFGPKLLDKYPVHTLEKSLAARVLSSMTVKENGIALSFGL